MRIRLLTTLAAAALAFQASAGDLTPPGAPSATMKTLDEVEPRIPIGPLTTPGDADSVHRITQPGSYYLTGNVAVPAGKRGIEIASGDVSVDLAGFAIRATQNGTLEGVAAIGGSLRNVSLTNGSINNVTGVGVHLGGAGGSVISDLRIFSSGDDGLRTGFAAVVERVVSTWNGGDGIVTSNGTTLRDCFSEFNAVYGFVGRMTAQNCTAGENGIAGFIGSGVFENCEARFNDGPGFYFNAPSVVTGASSLGNFGDGFTAINEVSIAMHCLASGNGGSGFAANNGGAWTATSCAAIENTQHGFWGGHRGRLVQCTAADNGANGYFMGGGAVVDSHSRDNGDDGVRTFGSNPVTVRECTIESNGAHGIVIAGDADNSLVVGNTINGHATAGFGHGIRIEGTANFVFIEGNYARENIIGIQVNTSGNTVLDNRMTANSVAPLGFVAGNDVAPLSSAAAATNPKGNIFN
ncbi:MAG: right-handed parallel beta-helix repeat-containing protein [Phycisphaerales bacterium]